MATLEDARHLAWGYVWQPPITPLFARLSLQLFGTSLRGFRFFAALPVAVALVLTGLMARELGGGRGAQLIAVVAALPISLVCGARLQYSSFDYLCWTLTSYCVLRLLKSDDPRWWMAIGGAIGLGMMAKYTTIIYVAALILGVLATEALALHPAKAEGYRQIALGFAAEGRMDDAAFALMEGGLITADPGLRSDLLDLYRSAFANSCAITAGPNGPTFNLSCDFVHKQFCAASVEAVKTVMDTGRRDLARKQKQDLLQKYGCPAGPLEQVLPD